MKLVLLFTIFAVLAYASANAVPDIDDDPPYELTPIEERINEADDASNSPVRQERLTCDLLSWESKWLTFRHSACALKCMMRRRKGGVCRGGVCICR